MIKLESLSVIAKPSTREDFKVVGTIGDYPPKEIEKMAFSWLQIQTAGRNSETVVLQKYNDTYWIMRAAPDVGNDESGREMYYIAFGKIKGNPDKQELIRSLLGAYKEDIPNKNVDKLPDIPVAKLEDIQGGAIENQILILTLDLSDTVIVSNIESAINILEIIGDDQIDYVAIMRSYIPPRLPSMKGIIISEVPQNQIDSGIDKILPDLKNKDIPDPKGLMKIHTEKERKEQLIHLALGFGSLESLDSLHDDEIEWLINSSDDGRINALNLASEKQIFEWIQKRRLNIEELEIVKDKLKAELSTHCLYAFKQDSDSLSRFIDIFGKEAAGVEELLEEPLKTMWEEIKIGEISNIPSEEDLALLDRIGLLDSLGLSNYSKSIIFLRNSAFFIKKWEQILVENGLHEEVAHYLISGNRLEVPPTDSPGLHPLDIWINAINTDRIILAGTWACKDQLWREWWVDAIIKHQDIDESFIPSLDKSWAEHIGWWLEGLICEERITKDKGLRVVARWLDEEGRGSIKQYHHIFKAAGITDIDIVDKIILNEYGDNYDKELSDISIAEIQILYKADVITEVDLVKAVEQGLDFKILSITSFDPNQLSFIDLDSIPPVDPPTSWDKYLSNLLSKKIIENDFWSRWSQGVTFQIVEWLDNELRGFQNGVLIQKLKSCFDRNVKLSQKEIKIFYGGLPPLLLYKQIILWLEDDSDEKLDTIELLVKSSSIPDNVSQWLKTELLSLDINTEMPIISGEEMVVLIPLIDRARVTIRRIMNLNHRIEGEEMLMNKIIEYIKKNKVLPLYPPNNQQAKLRPDWVKAITAINKWDDWKIKA